jgi:hypothetical protein
MAIRNKDTLKAYFLNGKKPNEEHFGDLLDSMTHKEEVIKADVEFASINEAEDGDNNQKSMSPFLVRKAIETLVKFDHAPTLKTEIESLISQNTNDLRNGVSKAYDTLSEIVSLVDRKATPANITTAVNDLKGAVSADANSLEKIEQLIIAIQATLESDAEILDNIQELVNTKATPANITTAVNDLKGAVSADANSLEKIEQLIIAIQATLESDTETLDNIQELVNYMKANKADITQILSDKLSISSLINNLDSTSTTTAPTANTVRLLKEMILALNNLSLGETSGTAYRGDRGKLAYDHSRTRHAPSNAQKNSDITKAEIEAKLTGKISSHSHNIESEVLRILEKKHERGFPCNFKASNNGSSIDLSWDAVILGGFGGLKWQLFYDVHADFRSNKYIDISIRSRNSQLRYLAPNTIYHFYLRLKVIGGYVNGGSYAKLKTERQANTPIFLGHTVTARDINEELYRGRKGKYTVKLRFKIKNTIGTASAIKVVFNNETKEKQITRSHTENTVFDFYFDIFFVKDISVSPLLEYMAVGISGKTLDSRWAMKQVAI